jgi:hypothetical protein
MKIYIGARVFEARQNLERIKVKEIKLIRFCISFYNDKNLSSLFPMVKK